jgi:hypothetical protein
MNEQLSDFAEQTRARGASVAAAEGPGAAPERPAADEAALLNLLRLLNQVRTTRPLEPVERAFVLGAREVFEELARVCDGLLAAPPSPDLSTTAGEQPSAPGEAPRATRPRTPRRPTPGGATPPPSH